MWNHIAAHISHVTGTPLEVSDRRSVGGGCINQGYRLSDGNTTYFVKLNQASKLAMFEAEAAGLQQMQQTHTIRVPTPICYGAEGESAYIVLEWLPLGRGDERSWQRMGQQLAAMHQAKVADQFGWERHNTIGSTPQINTWTADWTTFWVEHRLGHQLKLAQRRGGHFPLQSQLLAAVPHLLAGYTPQLSLVHGDLWSGNAAVTESGEPVIFDPATYVGDREVDLAMTELFGGFPASFYHGYRQVLSIDDGYQHRKTLYNLYHILNHFNLFGGSYEAQANRMMSQLLK
ncbi:MAG: fructosamine kinase family protein [Stenomitos rutilans HA7619-LM2]|nr:fructosamine kinase family protein [Stenomitos rutilans HA7619-LM2]